MYDHENSPTTSNLIIPPNVACFLCDSSHLCSRYRNHLTLEHGVMNEVEFLVQVSIYKQTHSSLPPLVNPEAGPIPKSSLIHSSSQTESRIEKEVAWAMCGVEDTEEAVENESKEEEEETFTFTCRLCDKDLKHIHKILVQHMKQVHLISLEEYLTKVQQCAESSLPNSAMFFCGLCNSRVEMKTEHLIKQHNMEEEVYDAMEAAGKIEDRMEGSSTCDVCGRLCLDLARHLRMSHKMSKDDYINNSDMGSKQVKVYNKETAPEGESTQLPTALRCYFDCGEVFKKDYQLKLHLKLKHRREDPEELSRAEWAAQQEIDLTRRSGSRLQCALCPVVLSCKSSLWTHVTRKHKITYQEYKAKHGIVKQDGPALFQCRICQRIIEHEAGNVSRHLAGLHGITWTQYMSLVRGEGGGLDGLPVIELVQCKVCGNKVRYLQPHLKMCHNINMDEYKYYVDNGGEVSLPEISLVKCEICSTSVKYFKEHLKRNHQITEKEYGEIVANEKTPPPIETVKCEICQNNVKYFSSHLTKAHKMNMARYKELVANKAFQYKDKMEINSKFDDNFDEPSGDISNTGEAKSFPESLFCSKNKSSINSRMVSTVKPSKADLLDKANTRCSLCQVEQGSRKRFIRHCQMVHKIRFKARPGPTVPLPPPEADLLTSLDDPVLKNKESESSVLEDGPGEKRVSNCDPPSKDGAETRRVKCNEKRKGSVQCNQCNKMFSRVDNMKKHKKIACRPQSDNMDLVREGVPCCDGCGKIFANKANIKRHKILACSSVLNV